MALIANTQRDPKKHRAFKPADFDPFSMHSKVSAKVGVGVLKTVFIDHRLPDLVLRSKEAHP